MSGVTHVLCDEPVETLAARAEQFAAQRAPARAVTSHDRPQAAGPDAQPRMSGAGQTRSQGMAPGTTRQADAPAGVQSSSLTARNAVDGFVANHSSAPGTESPAAPTTLAFASRAGVPRDLAAWPSPWRDWAVKIAPAPVLWTYHELGADLTGIGQSAERSVFFKNLIGELRLPKGSSVFWPSAMPVADSAAAGEALADAAIFSAGIARLSPQVVIVFGEQALADIGLGGAVRYFGQIVVEGRLLLLVPEIHTLLQNQTQRASTVSLLRAVLAAVSF